jgi:D-beta-D-heptose 7-phosphate kinase / D-beta-D-heptose 1-phosphate adenosyltransferase
MKDGMRPRVKTGRVVGRPAAARLAARLRRRGARVVFTNGVFDLLHVGHLDLLEKARALGDALVVGVNSDASVRRLKGPGRPIVPLRERMELLAGLKPVDYVVAFPEDTPAKLIAAIRPAILVKGADYRASEIVGAGTVRASGGRVVRVPLKPGRSTTGLVSRARIAVRARARARRDRRR